METEAYSVALMVIDSKTHTYMHMHTHTCTHAHTHVHTHTNTHTHTHTHTHTPMFTLTLWPWWCRPPPPSPGVCTLGATTACHAHQCHAHPHKALRCSCCWPSRSPTWWHTAPSPAECLAHRTWKWCSWLCYSSTPTDCLTLDESSRQWHLP